MKAAAVSSELKKRAGLSSGLDEEVLIHTGQHYDYELSAVFFDQLPIPTPAYNLEVGSGPHGAQTGAMLAGLEPILEKEAPDWTIVYGDTNSTLAAALAASKLRLRVAHVEAGLRSYRRDMPEEINRILADQLSSLLFCPTPQAVSNLASEGIVNGVHLSGDVMFDVLQWGLSIERGEKHLENLGVSRRGYALATIHRAGNTDDPFRLQSIFSALDSIANEGLPVVLPLHPRTRASSAPLPESVTVIDPVSYLEMLSLEEDARVIITDSGGVQKEAYWLGIPCVTLREETEWPETLQGGWNILAGAVSREIANAAIRPLPSAARPSIFGEGAAAAHIVGQLVDAPTAIKRKGK